MGILAVLVATGVFWLPTIPSSAEQIQFGMTREQIEAIMGQPQIVEGGNRAVWFDGAWVGVKFDADGHVLYKTSTPRMSVLDYFAFKVGWR